MTPRLEDLTEELLDRILSLITPRSSLYSAALVSKTLNRLATSHLYAKIDFWYGPPYRGLKHLLPVTFLCFQKPHIASSIRSFSMRGTYGKAGNDKLALADSDQDAQDEYARMRWPSHPDLEPIIRSAIHELGYEGEDADEWFSTLIEGNDESAVLAILVPTLKNLKKLDIEIDGSSTDQDLFFDMIDKFTTAEGPSETIFSELTDILLEGYDEKYPTSPEMLGACLKLPALRRIHAIHLGECEQDKATETFATLQKGSCVTEEIELRDSQLYNKDLELMLGAPKALKTFIYEMGHSWCSYTLDTDEVSRALSQQQGSLENLVLVHPEYFGELEDDNFGPMRFGRLDKLEYLKVSTVFLGGLKDRDSCSLETTFPRDLKRLVVTYFGEPEHCSHTAAALSKVLQSKDNHLPKLEKLTLEGPFKSNEEALESACDVARLAKNRGVEVKLFDDRYRRTYIGEKERRWGIDESVEWQEAIHNTEGEKEAILVDN